MKILIIEDDSNKYNRIHNTLKIINEEVEIIRAKSRNSRLLIYLNSINNNNLFDLIICDKYLPFINDEIKIYPFTSEIIEIIKNKDERMPVCVISYDDIQDCNYGYYIKYNSLIDLYEYLEKIVKDIKQNKKIKPKVNKLIKKEDR